MYMYVYVSINDNCNLHSTVPILYMYPLNNYYVDS